jgi:putative transposase
MGRTGTALDNAMAESFIATLKTELVHGRRFPDREVARSAIFEYLEGFYNRRRLHSALSYQSPMSYEELQWKERPWRRCYPSTKPK